ncbi:porin [Alcaligenaceae bacterium]|nr:porin [Alcaligenaceae bacterium]
MKKTLLAAALTLGFAGVAQAETSVTLYGVIDAGLGYQQSKGNISYLEGRTDATSFKNTRTGMVDGNTFGQMGPRWGLKGVEDLGDGLRVVFQLESGFKVGTGTAGQNGQLFGRHATVGLASDSWGQLDLGRQTNIASKYLPGVADPFGGAFGMANMGASFTAANTTRWDNMVMYQTPNFSGFQFGVGYSFNVAGAETSKRTFGNFSDETNPNNRGITTGLRYANGPIGVALTYDQVKMVDFNAPGGYAGESLTAKAWNLGGSYDFEVVKLHAAFGQTRNAFVGGSSFADTQIGNGIPGTGTDARELQGTGFKANSYLLGLTAPLGGGKLMASWQMMDPRSVSDQFDADYGVAGYNVKKQQTYSLGYVYGLSKRTSVYALGSYAKNVAFRPDSKSQVLGVGLTHQF